MHSSAAWHQVLCTTWINYTVQYGIVTIKSYLGICKDANQCTSTWDKIQLQQHTLWQPALSFTVWSYELWRLWRKCITVGVSNTTALISQRMKINGSAAGEFYVFFRLEKGWRSRSHSRRQLSSIPKKPWVPERSRPARLALISKRSPALNDTIKGFYLQLSSIRMKSLMPRFSRKTPDEEVVLKRKEMSALSSPWNVGKWRYEVSLSKNAAFHTFSAKKSIESDEEIEKIRQRSAFVHSSIYDKAA